MKTNVILDGSFELFEVYMNIHDKILVNLARHFPYATHVPSGSFQYQAKMLAQMGMVEKETAAIIQRYMPSAAGATKDAIEAAIYEALGPTEPKLRAAVKRGFLRDNALPDPVASQMQAFRAYYNQSIDKMNLVNTTMLESTKEVYRATVADISNKLGEIQTSLNTEAGAVISGVSSYNKAVSDAVDKMVDVGITGFVDRAGKHWRPEVYAATVIRSTSMNAARESVFERNEQYGNDLYQVSTHNGARPLCYPWQGKVISRTDNSREVEDFDGNKVHVYAQSETSYGEAAGLFGINCGHYPMVFIPGFSVMRGQPQDPEENAKTYEESQKQRALERKLRDEKLTYDVEKARGADPERLRYQRQRVRDASNEIDEFCSETGRARRRNREYHPINATWPDRPEGITPPLDPPSGWGGGPTPPGSGVTMPTPTVPNTPPVAPSSHYGAAVDALPAEHRAEVTSILDAAPETSRRAWEKAQGQMKAPEFALESGKEKLGAYFNPSNGTCFFDGMGEAFDQSEYQDAYVTWFHEYGHNADWILGRPSVNYQDGAFGRSLYDECGKRVIDFYGSVMGQTVDPIELVMESQAGDGGMGVGSYFRYLARDMLSRDEWMAIRSTVIDWGDDAARWRGFLAEHDNIAKFVMEDGERILKQKISSPSVKDAFRAWVKSNFTLTERADVSDMFCEWAIDTWGKDANCPFGVGHDYDYWRNTIWGEHGSLATEAFAEMYSATVTRSQSLPVIKEMFPESYAMFLKMLEELIL